MVTDDMVTTRVLMPGEYCFSDGYARIQTLLGSCVSIVAWHPLKHLGAMCHYILPARHGHHVPDPRYADEFFPILFHDMQRHGTHYAEYQFRLYGAANMFRKQRATCSDSGDYMARCQNKCMSVSCRNRLAAIVETAKYRLNVMEIDLGGTECRFIEFRVGTGEVHVRKTPHTAVINSIVS